MKIETIFEPPTKPKIKSIQITLTERQARIIRAAMSQLGPFSIKDAANSSASNILHGAPCSINEASEINSLFFKLGDIFKKNA